MALRPERVFWALVGLRFVTWWLLPTLVARTAPLDMIEGLVWGREWQWGYWKHPPLAAWLLEATVSLFGARLPALFLLGPACVAVTLGLVWRLARRLLDPSWALVAVLALDGIYYYGYASPKLNPDLLQLPLWAGAVLLLHTALTSRRLAAWLGFGLLVGLGVLAKYYTIALVVALLPVLLVTTEGRRSWRTPGPWLAALVAFAVVAPHLVWLAEMDFISLRYAQARAQSDIAALQRVTEPASFLAGQVAIALPLLLLLLVAGWRPRQFRKGRLATLDGALLLAAGLGPMLVTMATGAIFGLRLTGGSRENWGTPLLSFVGVVLLLLAELREPKLRRFLTAWTLLFGLQVLAYPLAIRVGPVLGRRVDRVRIPGRALAEHVESIWRSRGSPPACLRAMRGSPATPPSSWRSGRLSTSSCAPSAAPGSTRPSCCAAARSCCGILSWTKPSTASCSPNGFRWPRSWRRFVCPSRS